MKPPQLPLVYVSFGRELRRDRGWVLYLLLAPFPLAEQNEGCYVRALLNASWHFDARWPFVTCKAHCADRMMPGS